MAARSLLVLAALAATSAASQPVPVDLVASGGLAVEPSGVSFFNVAPSFGLAMAVTPSAFGSRFRLRAAAFVSPEGGAGLPNRTAALGLGIEAPLSGGRNGVYLSFGGAYVDYDGPSRGGACTGPECPTHTYGQDRFRGLAWAGGIGARVPLAERVFARGEAGALVGGTEFALSRVSVGVGYRLR